VSWRHAAAGRAGGSGRVPGGAVRGPGTGRGDFLYEVAWFTFWAPWHAGLAAIDFRSAILRHYQAAGLDVPRFDERLRCYELHVGLTHLAYCTFTGDPGRHLPSIARRTREILG
jgi:hypothetical protein